MQVEKLERANTMLRTKNRDANRAAKTAAARIAELEDQVARLEKQAAPAAPPPPAKRGPKPVAPVRSKRQRRGVDPGDAVPPGVAVEEPAPLDEEAENDTREPGRESEGRMIRAVVRCLAATGRGATKATRVLP